METHPPGHSAVGPAADALVIFGITGDLAKLKTYDALYDLERREMLDLPIIGVAIDDYTDEQLHARAEDSIREQEKTFDEEVFKRLAGRLTYVKGDYKDPKTFETVKKRLGDAVHPVFYLETPPSLFGLVVTALHTAGMTEGARVVIEKPFGHDYDSAVALNDELAELLEEEQIYRIDHFLGKEPVMDLLYLRFANTMLEPIWNRRYVNSVQITMAESLGVEDRGSFYDPVGTLRDVVQNHLLQLLALFAMEPPSGGTDPDPVRDKKLDLFRSIKPADPDRYFRGQYEGYLDVEGVAPDSQTETFCALELEVENWRWSGVPFYIRAGKSLETKVTELRLILNSPPAISIAGSAVPKADEMIVRIDPDGGAIFLVEAKEPGADTLRRVHLELLFDQELGEQPGPYERLLGDALAGDPGHFAREDHVEATWRIVQPLLDDPGPVEPYKPGGWGPEGAFHLPVGHGGWRRPWVPGEDPST